MNVPLCHINTTLENVEKSKKQATAPNYRPVIALIKFFETLFLIFKRLSDFPLALPLSHVTEPSFEGLHSIFFINRKVRFTTHKLSWESEFSLAAKVKHKNKGGYDARIPSLLERLFY